MRNRDTAKEQLIMNTALSMISEIGLAGVKMNDLAKRAGVATGTLYIYFTSKEELIRKLYAYVCCELGSDLQKNIQEGASLKEKLRQICKNYTLDLLTHPEYKVFMDQYFCSPFFRNEDDIQHLENAIYLDPVVKLIMDAKEEKQEITVAPELLIQISRGALEKYAHYVMTSGKPWDDREFDLVFHFIWNGAKPQKMGVQEERSIAYS